MGGWLSRVRPSFCFLSNESYHYFVKTGLDRNFVCIHSPNYTLFPSVVDHMYRSGVVDLICIDSVSAHTPRAEIEVC